MTTHAANTGTAELLDQIQELMDRNRANRDPEIERRIVELRHQAGARLVSEAIPGAEYAAPSPSPVGNGSSPPEVGPEDLSPGLLRAAILGNGCLLIRGLLEREDALTLADGIETAFQARAAGESPADGYYQEFTPDPPYHAPEREWVEMAGGLLAGDAPRVMFQALDMLESVGFLDLVHGYLGERGSLSLQKMTLRKAAPEVAGGWHQDGSFLGEVRPLNLWLSLSRCGDVAPGLDILPKRLPGVLPAGGEGTSFPIQVHEDDIERAADGVEIVRPIFEPGDALVFDEIFLHKTGSDPEMPNPRYAIESWFFGVSSFAPKYAPLAI
jgi:hypothetical protein